MKSALKNLKQVQYSEYSSNSETDTSVTGRTEAESFDSSLASPVQERC